VTVQPSPPAVVRPPAPEVRAHWALYLVLGVITFAVLVYGAAEQIFDTNFLFLWEATPLLAGDHPYRDFYEMGWPLMTLMSAGVQWAVGYRLVGEFLIQWTFMVASVLVGFHLAIRTSRSVWASLTTTVIAIAIVAATPTYHFPKLFFYPVAVWVAWWYLEAPNVRRGVVVGLVTAAAFLYRHDHGVYIGVGAMLAFVLARVINPASRRWQSSAREVVAFTAAVALPLLPWAILVQRNEGLIDYVRTRAEWGAMWSAHGFPYEALRDFNPASVITAGVLPSRVTAEHWLVQLTLLLPVFVLLRVADGVVSDRDDKRQPSSDACRTVIAAAMVIVVALRLFREDSYFVAVLPLAAALGAQLLAGPGPGATPVWRIVQRVLAISALFLTCVAAVGYLNAWDLLKPSEFNELGPTFHQLLTSPPIDALQPGETALQVQHADWPTIDSDRRKKILLRYMHDCTRDGDRILVTGSTPYDVDYYVERPIAGGHIEWHHGWRSDPIHARESLQLLQNQSVPFAFSTNDPVLDDLEKYPDIRYYFEQNYDALEGSHGQLLVDRRRQPTGRFGALGFPCFR
jgi:hypothetical protein